MEKDNPVLTDKQLDFFRDMMSIGAGNAATAFSELLDENVEVAIPDVKLIPIYTATEIVNESEMTVFSVKMRLVGDVQGDMFFLIPERQKKTLIQFLERQRGAGAKIEGITEEISAMMETGSILAGVYLTAIHDICKLTIYHSIAVVATDKITNVLDEAIVELGGAVKTGLVIESRFSVASEEEQKFIMIVFIMGEFVDKLSSSINDAIIAQGMKAA